MHARTHARTYERMYVLFINLFILFKGDNFNGEFTYKIRI